MATRKKRNTEPKGETLRLRLTDEEKATFEATAKHLGINLSAFARLAMTAIARDKGIIK